MRRSENAVTVGDVPISGKCGLQSRRFFSVASAFAGVAYWRILSAKSSSHTISATPVPETIDLSQAGTTRGGEASTVPPITLPRRVVAAHILLPYFSPGGNYAVAVTLDRNRNGAKAEGSGTANVNDFLPT